ncbi:MAG: hypothetical protein U1F50_10850 [Rubrivivax sp.]
MRRLTRRQWLAAAAAGLVAPRAGAAAQDLDWQDASRARAVPVRLHWPPAALAAAAPLPLLLFSPGFGGDRQDAAWLGPVLAERGIACAHVQHVGSDRRAWAMGPIDWVLREWRGEFARERLARTQDLRFVLDRLLAGEWGRAVDRRRIAAIGHSLGAQTVARWAARAWPAARASATNASAPSACSAWPRSRARTRCACCARSKCLRCTPPRKKTAP